MLQECYPGEERSVSLLRDLRREVNSWLEIDPESGAFFTRRRDRCSRDDDQNLSPKILP